MGFVRRGREIIWGIERCTVRVVDRYGSTKQCVLHRGVRGGGRCHCVDNAVTGHIPENWNTLKQGFRLVGMAPRKGDKSE